jgi:hypothetical protein
MLGSLPWVMGGLPVGEFILPPGEPGSYEPLLGLADETDENGFLGLERISRDPECVLEFVGGH